LFGSATENDRNCGEEMCFLRRGQKQWGGSTGVTGNEGTIVSQQENVKSIERKEYKRGKRRKETETGRAREETPVQKKIFSSVVEDRPSGPRIVTEGAWGKIYEKKKKRGKKKRR